MKEFVTWFYKEAFTFDDDLLAEVRKELNERKPLDAAQLLFDSGHHPDQVAAVLTAESRIMP